MGDLDSYLIGLRGSFDESAPNGIFTDSAVFAVLTNVTTTHTHTHTHRDRETDHATLSIAINAA